jgi:four helix bundle protein
MGQDSLENFGGYGKGLTLFDLVVDDMETLKDNPLCWKLIGQQVASADSIPANIEEGYGRRSKSEYGLFLSYARGSARETRGRYLRMRRWLDPSAVQERIQLCDEIIGILTSTMNRFGTTGGSK